MSCWDPTILMMLGWLRTENLASLKNEGDGMLSWIGKVFIAKDLVFRGFEMAYMEKLEEEISLVMVSWVEDMDAFVCFCVFIFLLQIIFRLNNSIVFLPVIEALSEFLASEQINSPI